MAWDKVLNRARNRFGPLWVSEPAISVSKSGITFNTTFVERFAIDEGTPFHILLDRTTKRIGLKVVNANMYALGAITTAAGTTTNALSD